MKTKRLHISQYIIIKTNKQNDVQVSFHLERKYDTKMCDRKLRFPKCQKLAKKTNQIPESFQTQNKKSICFFKQTSRYAKHVIYKYFNIHFGPQINKILRDFRRDSF